MKQRASLLSSPQLPANNLPGLCHRSGLCWDLFPLTAPALWLWALNFELDGFSITDISTTRSALCLVILSLLTVLSFPRVFLPFCCTDPVPRWLPQPGLCPQPQNNFPRIDIHVYARVLIRLSRRSAPVFNISQSPRSHVCAASFPKIPEKECRRAACLGLAQGL